MKGKELVERRQALGLSQERLAAKLGVTSGTISEWERGARPIVHGEMLDLALKQLEQDNAEAK